MASDLRLRVGGVTATITLNGANGQISDSQVADALRRYAASLGIPLDGTAQENLTAILEHIRRDVRQRASQAHSRELHSEADATIAATVSAANEI